MEFYQVSPLHAIENPSYFVEVAKAAEVEWKLRCVRRRKVAIQLCKCAHNEEILQGERRTQNVEYVCLAETDSVKYSSDVPTFLELDAQEPKQEEPEEEMEE